jgi:hypothetical protein
MEKITPAEALARAKHPMASKSELRALARHEDIKVRIATWLHPNCPKDVRAALKRVLNKGTVTRTKLVSKS